MSPLSDPDAVAAAENRQYGKWNGILAASQSARSAFLVYQNHSKMFPEPLLSWVHSVKSVVRRQGICPVRLDIDITNLCNNNCIMCFSRGLPKVSLTLNQTREVIDAFASLGGVSVRLTGGGDALMHPHIQEIFRIVSARKLLLTLETNGDLLAAPGLADAVARHVHHLRVSVDAGNNESRSLVHRPRLPEQHSYDDLLSHLRSVRQRSHAVGRGHSLFLGATFLILPENYQTIGRFLADMESVGTDWVAIRRTLDRSVYSTYPGMEDYAEAEIARVKSPRLHVERQYAVSFSPHRDFSECW